jgi:hypothetical protein
MPFHIIEELSLAGSDCNEDFSGHRILADSADLWIIDGATSLADKEYLGSEITDPAWWAQNIGRSIEDALDSIATPEEILQQAVEQRSADYAARVNGTTVPDYAKPLAAIAWMRAVVEPERVKLNLLGMADCRVLIQSGNRIINFPSSKRKDIVVQETISGDGNEERTRNGVILSHVPSERIRRALAHTDPVQAKLGFHPDSVFYANRETVALTGDFNVLAMSDGFYRLVDEYGLRTDRTLLEAAEERGLQALFKELRDYEHKAELRRAHAIKRRDDATAVLMHFRH